MSFKPKDRWAKTNLTRWNRAGLTELTYSDGNAADFLEVMRQYWKANYGSRWKQQLDPLFDLETLNEEEDDEDWLLNAINQQLLEQYNGDRGDIAWELGRAFVRSCHVLTQHINAHANEAFLRTATEWDYMRKMVAMLGYHPAGAASATTLLAIEARADGRVDKGLQVRYRPTDGGKTIVFETLEDIDVSDRFNFFRVDGWNISKTTLQSAESVSNTSNQPWQENPKAPVNISDSAIIINDLKSDAEAAWIVDKKDNKIRLEHEGDNWRDWSLGNVRLMTSPRFRRKPWINGESIRRTSLAHGLSKGSVIAWRREGQVNASDWKFAEVARADSFGIELKPGPEFEENYDRNSPDHEWLSWGTGDIKIRRASRIVGSYTIPAEGGIEAEKYVGKLKSYFPANLFDTTVATEVAEDDSKVILFNNSGDSGDARLEDLPDSFGSIADMKEFISWLFKVAGFAMSFPVTPLELVRMGAMLLVKDARIPSTGQLVFEAFLDLFGGNSGDSINYTTENTKPNVPALFRFWMEEDTSGDSSNGNSDTSFLGASSQRLPFSTIKGELWYLPSRHVSGNSQPVTIDDPDFLEVINQHDKKWFFFNGSPSGLLEGQWAAAKFAGSNNYPLWQAVKIKSIKTPLQFQQQTENALDDPTLRYKDAKGFAVLLDQLPVNIGDAFNSATDSEPQIIPELLELQADYRAIDQPTGVGQNIQSLSGKIKLTPCPGKELIGRTLLASDEKGSVQAVRVTSVDNCTVTLSPPLSDPFNEGNLKLYGNVVRAGHGKTQPRFRTGIGDGPNRQEFITLSQQEISTVPDARLLHGVREDIEVRVDGELWQQKPRLDDSKPTDRHYVVTTTEDGYAELKFGDGQRGRALPPGNDNVEIQYRVGAGIRGSSLQPHSLEQLVTSHSLVKSILQPQPTVGGNEMEQPQQMGEKAPASLLALERAVSLHDFEQLAMQHRSVVHASAFYEQGVVGTRDCVNVYVSGVGGQVLSVNMRRDIAAYLKRHCLPAIRVQVLQHSPVDVEVEIKIRVDYSRYESHKVAEAVTIAVSEYFSADNRSIGKPIAISEIYEIVESTMGVEDSECTFTLPINSKKLVLASRGQLASLKSREAVRCIPSEFEL